MEKVLNPCCDNCKYAYIHDNNKIGFCDLHKIWLDEEDLKETSMAVYPEDRYEDFLENVCSQWEYDDY